MLNRIRKPMKLVAWNLGHQCREDPIHANFCEAIEELDPDVLLLNEYVHGESRRAMLANLSLSGLPNLKVSPRLNGNNQVLIASRYALEQGDLTGPRSKDQGGEANFLHVKLPQSNLELVGIRAPAYAGTELRSYWEALMALIRSCASRRIVFIGDFNTDPDSLSRPTARHLRALRDEGWSVPSPAGDWSFMSKKSVGTRIDHVVASAPIRVLSAAYVANTARHVLASASKGSGISDHAPIVVSLAAEDGDLNSDKSDWRTGCPS